MMGTFALKPFYHYHFRPLVKFVYRNSTSRSIEALRFIEYFYSYNIQLPPLASARGHNRTTHSENICLLYTSRCV